MSLITLKNMEFHAFHGCLEHERTIGNTFFVSVSMEIDTAKAEKSDELLDTINYKLVYDAVKEQMEIPSNLIENVAYRIKSEITSRFPGITGLKVELSKIQPPVGGRTEKVTIEL